MQQRLNTIQSEVYDAVNLMRAEGGLGNAFEYPERAEEAQRKAEYNSVTGTEENSDENIGMLQHHLPREAEVGPDGEILVPAASGYEFIEAFRGSEPHYNVLMEPTNQFMAVGTAYSAHDDTVWLVIQFE